MHIFMSSVGIILDVLEREPCLYWQVVSDTWKLLGNLKGVIVKYIKAFEMFLLRDFIPNVRKSGG